MSVGGCCVWNRGPQGCLCTYRTIVADPPWLERGAGKCKRGADRHYSLLSSRDIPRVMMSAPDWRIADDAHMYLWITDNFLQDGLYVASQLGFRYVRTLAWFKGDDAEQDEDIKLQMGIGQYLRGQHELCLFCVRGDGYAVRTERRDIGSAIIARRGEHSAKPEAFYQLVEQRSYGPYLEMFSRRARPGWAAWGNQVAPIADTPEVS